MAATCVVPPQMAHLETHRMINLNRCGVEVHFRRSHFKINQGSQLRWHILTAHEMRFVSSTSTSYALHGRITSHATRGSRKRVLVLWLEECCIRVKLQGRRGWGKLRNIEGIMIGNGLQSRTLGTSFHFMFHVPLHLN